jgi:3-dehydroquinate dehydratase / shikimate dehydrogenase
MTRLCVAIFVNSPDQAKRDAALAAEFGADVVELRVDRLTDSEIVAALVKEISLPTIVTCRPTWEGGESPLDDRQRASLILVASDKAFARDVELKLYREFFVCAWEIAAGLSPPDRPLVIMSTHDFTGRPERLGNLVLELNAAEADVAKIVWTARTVRDNLEAFEILQQRQKPTIALCMGEAGLISRILAKKFGAFLTFASLEDGAGTAPGQISIHDMKRLYRWDAINVNTKVYGVVAAPVAHSMSPAIHNAAFDETGHDGVYLPLLVNPGYESFKAFIESFISFEGLDLSGLSVTLPHKENVLRYLKEKGAEVEPLAEQIGAVNTVIIRRDLKSQIPILNGINTDYAAILDSITPKLGIARDDLAGYRVAVIGAGGTGRTAVAALAHYGATIVVYNRTKDRAEALAQEFSGHSGKVVAASMDKLCDSCCQVYINTTSIGMHPNISESPFGDRPPKLAPETIVFDTVYNPPNTKFLQQAESAGAKTIGGVEMFVRQAAAQFEAWTGLIAPSETMRRVVEMRLAR